MAEGNHTAQIPTTQDAETELTDARPILSSPYASPVVTLYFGDGPPLHVHAALLHKTPKLSSRLELDKALHLEDIPGDSGHVLVHHLFTGEYQYLKPVRLSSQDEGIAEFVTSIRVYGIAQAYDLSALKDLAQSEIERLGRGLQATQILEVMLDVRPTLAADDTWLHSYLKSLLESLMDSPPTSLSSASPGRPGQTLSIVSVLRRVMVDSCREQANSPLSSPDLSVVCQDHSQGARGQKETVVTSSGAEPTHNSKLIPTKSPQEHVVSEVLSEATKNKKTGDERSKKEEGGKTEVTDETKSMIALDSTPGQVVTSLPEESIHQVIQVYDMVFPKPKQGSDPTPFGSVPGSSLGNSVQSIHSQQLNEGQKSSPTPTSMFATTSGDSFVNQSSKNKPNCSNHNQAPRESNMKAFFMKDVSHVPLTRRGSWYRDIYNNSEATVDRFQHICVQNRFANFSPEELRWKHELCK